MRKIVLIQANPYHTHHQYTRQHHRQLYRHYLNLVIYHLSQRHPTVTYQRPQWYDSDVDVDEELPKSNSSVTLTKQERKNTRRH